MDERLEPGLTHSRTDPASGQSARLGIFGSPIASRRSLIHNYHIVPNDVRYFAIAPLNDCPFDPDVVTITCTPRQATMASRALQYYTGKAAIGETGRCGVPTSRKPGYQGPDEEDMAVSEKEGRRSHQ